MSKPNFHAMSQKELHDYVDKLHLEGNWIEMPPLQSEQDLENYPQFIERIRSSSQPRDGAV